MANVLGKLFGDIADAIREKTGDTATMKPAEFPEKIGGIDVPKVVENYPVVPDFSNGDQLLTAPDGYAVKSAIYKKPETLIPENILKGVNIAGIDGELEVGGGSSEDVRYVTFMSYDGTVEYGKKAVAVGDDCADPIARGVFATPTRESTAQYDYSFYGWATTPNGAADANWNKAVTEDRTVYANFAAMVRYYTITYYDSDGSTVLKTESLAYGSMPSYAPAKDGFAFTGWTPVLSTVTGNASYQATWTSVITFSNASWEQIAEIVASGKAQETFSLKDTKTLVLTNDDGTTLNVPVTIAAFSHDDLADGSGKAGITIVFDKVVTTIPVGDTPNSYQWATLSLRNSLNSGVIYGMFPESLKSVVKPVKKISARGMGLGSFTNGSLHETEDSFWCLSAAEVGLTGHWGTDEGTAPYPVFTDNQSRIKYSLSKPQSRSVWNLRTGHSSYAGAVAMVTGDGLLSYSSFKDSANHKELVIGFCI